MKQAPVGNNAPPAVSCTPQTQMAAAYTMMDAQYAHHDQQQQPTQLAKQIGVQHLCDHRCQVQHMFGNAFRCDTSGQVCTPYTSARFLTCNASMILHALGRLCST